MTLELAHQLALTKLVELLQTLTDPAEIRRVATAILRIKPPKQPKAEPCETTNNSSVDAAVAQPTTSALDQHAVESSEPARHAPSFPTALAVFYAHPLTHPAHTPAARLLSVVGQARSLAHADTKASLLESRPPAPA